MKEYRTYAYRYLILLVATASIILLWKNTLLITLVLLTLAVLINKESSRKEVIFYILVSILATLVESSSIMTGAWVYSSQHILNFPVWLPLYWGMGGIAMKDTYLILNRIIKD